MTTPKRDASLQPNDDPFASIQADVKAQQAAAVPDVIPPTFAERMIAAIEKTHGPLPPPPPVTGATIRASCRFCKGRGCLNCDTLAQREYDRQFPQGPQPLATIRLDDPEDVALFPTLLAGIRDAQTPDEVLQRVMQNAAEVHAIQDHLASHEREDQS